MTVAGERVDPMPLMQRVMRDNGLVPFVDQVREDIASAQRLADVLGVTRRQIARWRSGSQMRVTHADEIVGRLGYHLLDIWPELYREIGPDQGERECSADDCEVTFTPYRPQQIFCSKRCRQRITQRTYRARHPEVGAALNARYYQEAREYLLRKQKAYDDANRERINAHRRATYAARREQTKAEVAA